MAARPYCAASKQDSPLENLAKGHADFVTVDRYNMPMTSTLREHS